MRFALVLLVACSSSNPKPAPPATPPPAEPTPSTAMTEEECKTKGGQLRASKGDSSPAHCEPGETELGAVRFGIEGGWCCK